MAKILVYQLYPVAWKTGLKGMIEMIPRIARLDVDYIWFSPLYFSPRFDQGYDIADYKVIDPRFGTIEEFDIFVEIAHRFGVGVLMDLVLNHTSTEHRWFKESPEYYCWSKEPPMAWENLFDKGSAWEYDESRGYYYLHLFHSKQADLRWFNNCGEELNVSLVNEFREIVRFWTKYHKVDGFRLDVPQSINKDFSKEKLTFSDMICGTQAIEVINAIFPRNQENSPFLMMECFDPMYGPVVEKYYKRTAVDYALNVLLKDNAFDEKGMYSDAFKRNIDVDGLMLDFESHDSIRFPSRGYDPKYGIRKLFDSGVEGICIYQGQELGLSNPTKEELPDKLMLELDAQTEMLYLAGGNLDELRKTSRANARVPVSMEEYARQEKDDGSILNFTKDQIDRWRMR